MNRFKKSFMFENFAQCVRKREVHNPYIIKEKVKERITFILSVHVFFKVYIVPPVLNVTFV